MLTQTIPVVDLDDFVHGDSARRGAFVEKIGSALAEVGFFALENHGIDSDLIKRAYAEGEAFFLLDEGKKLPYQRDTQRGYTRYGQEHAKDQASPDLKEFWQVGRQDDAEGNHFPDAETPQFGPTMSALYASLERTALLLLDACSEALGLEPDFLSNAATGGDSILRVIHYPPVPAGANPASVRAAAHEDINFITLLCESTAQGLELKKRDGSWLPIASLPGQIIVDSGDMLQNLTNGLMRSTTHRVVNPDNSRERRFSMPFFVHPRGDVDLTPLPRCVSQSGGEERYPSWSAREMLAERLRAIGLTA